jgi:hypothetical protein
MKRLIIVCAILSSAFSSWANPNLNLLSGTEWRGACRKVVNEAGKEIKKQPYSRLQSTYLFEDGRLSWSVKAFKDTSCKDIYEINKDIFNCAIILKDEFANCNQIKWEYSKDGKDWESKPMLDHAGYPNILKMKIAAKRFKSGKIEITTIGESGEHSKEVLSK